MIFASMLFGDQGTTWVTLLIMYPSLIIMLGNIGLSDLHTLKEVLIAKNVSPKGKLSSTVFVLGRGGCFTAGAIVFIIAEFKVLRDAL
jgi:hypothetical protein